MVHNLENIPFPRHERKLKLFVDDMPSYLISSCKIHLVQTDMVWKPGELESVYNELRFYVELASPCTNLLKFCLLIFQ